MTDTFKVLSLLLSYPTEALQAEAPHLRAAMVAEGLIDKRGRDALDPLFASLAGDDLYDLQERYVFLFDRTRSLSLHLFEHIHGESRDRGQAMVDLQDMYAENGLEISAREMPDFLPLFLEFLATRPLDAARELLGQPLHIISALKERLHKRGSVYAGVFQALEQIAAAKVEKADVQALLAEPEDDPADLAALDAVWEEEAVSFGGPAGAASCGLDRIRTQIRAAERRVPDPLPDAG